MKKEYKLKKFYYNCHSELVSESLKHEMLKQVQHDKKHAFTLAEVLITLTIIGVIAALTIPNLMQKWQKQATVSKMSKGYNMLQRMAVNIKQNTGCDDLNCTGLYNLVSDKYDSKEFTQKFLELANVKDYKLVHTPFTKAIHVNCSGYSNECSYNNIFQDHFVTQDGLLYSVRKAGRYDIAGENAIIVFLGTEKRKQNDKVEDDSTYKLGRNLFLFTIYDDFKVEPVVFFSTSENVTPLSKTSNTKNIKNYCNPNGTGTGQGTSCAARIITDGWKMNY